MIDDYAEIIEDLARLIHEGLITGHASDFSVCTDATCRSIRQRLQRLNDRVGEAR